VNDLLAPIQDLQGAEWLMAARDVWELRVSATWDNQAEIPREGAVVFAANHPVALVDTLATLPLLLPIRPDTKLLALKVSRAFFPALGDVALDIPDPHDRLRGAASLRALYAHLERGGAVLTFPAGHMSYFAGPGRCEDPPWAPGFGRLVRKYRLTVVPMHVSGCHRLIYYAVRHVHDWASMLLLLHELLAKRGAQLGVRIGRPIAYEQMSADLDNAGLAAWLRDQTYALASG
jgi:putative hemolysin